MDKYGLLAKYYDAAYDAKADLVDLDFYLDLAKKNGGPVLEIGCGTGRVLTPIARAGLDIWGVDVSAAMLAILKQKIRVEPEAVKARVRVAEGDMRRFDLGVQFPLAIMPFRAMQHMATVDDQIAALATAKRHLSGDGLLVFDVFNPKLDLIAAGVGSEIREMAWQSGENEETVRFFRKEAVDTVNMSFSGSFIFRVYRDGRLVSEEEDRFEMSFYTYPHLQLLFRAVDLEVIDAYGSFDKKPLAHGAAEMIFALKRAS